MIDLRASMPVSDDSGTVSQTIAMVIDPAKVKLTAATDIIAPNGWTVEYSVDGTNFTAAAPATAVGWAAVRAVRASGNVQTLGSDNGFQVAQGTATGSAGSTAPAFIASSGTGDGYEAFFDPGRTRVFNLYHHEFTYPPNHQYYYANVKTLDCHVLATGGTCAGFPYEMRVGTNHVALGKVVGEQLWVAGTWDNPTDSPDQGWKIGYECVDLAAVLKTPSSVVTAKVLTNNVVTLTTGATHNLNVGDTVLVAGVGSPFDGSYTVTATPSTTTFSYARINANIASAAATGNVGGAPKGCATPWVPMASFNMSAFSTDNPPRNFNNTIDLVGSSYTGSLGPTKLWTMNAQTGALYCLDTALNAPCSSMPSGGWTIPWPGGALTAARPSSFSSAYLDASIEIWDGRIYLKAWASGVDSWRLTCVMQSNPSQACPGFSGTTSGFTSGQFRVVDWGKLVQLPAADGSTRGVCLIGRPVQCLDSSGTPFGAPSSLSISSYNNSYAPHPVRLGTRITYANTTDIFCWDAALAGGAGAGCFGGSGTLPAGTLNLSSSGSTSFSGNYTLVLDPIVPDCAWIGMHQQPTLRTINMKNGLLGTNASPACAGLATTRMSFSGSPVIPRMGCNVGPNDTAVRSWRSFALTSPGSGFTSATLTVQAETGANIPGWTNVPLTAGTSPPYSRAFDDATLPVSLTGQNPKFIVDLVNGASVTSGSAVVQAVGDAPQLCLKPVVIAQCNQTAGLGPVKPLLFQSAPLSVSGTGSASPGGSFGTDTKSVGITSPTASQCGSTLTGRATDGAGGSGNPAAGVTVTLLDDSGTVVLDDSGNAMTAVTDASGAYSFGLLKPGAYKVRFPSSAAATSVTAQTASGGTGSDPGVKTAISGTSTSGTTVLAVGTAGVVNGQYIVNPVARPNVSSGAQGAAQTISPLADDSASTGATYSGGSTALKLCLASEVSPNCTGASRVMAQGQGVYTVSGTTVTFTPCSTTVGNLTVNGVAYATGCTGTPFTGTATAATYQSTDSLGLKASSTVTPTVIAAPIATNDTSSGAFATAQPTNVRSNDMPGAGQSVVVSSIELCTTATTDATCDSTNYKSLVVANQGIYTVDDTTGIVTFTPCRAANTPTMSPACTSGFSGVATPIKYIVKDGLGQIGSATITPTVTAPPTVVPAADTTSGAQGAAQSINPLANDDTVVSAVSLDATSVKICTTATADSSCTSTSAVVVPGKGAYTVNAATGIITFTPCSANGTPSTPSGINCTGAFTGTPDPVKYAAKDNLGRVVTSTYTPTVVGIPTASADSSSGAFGAMQTLSVLASDVAGAGGSLLASSVRVCASGTAAASCMGSTYVSAGRGVFTVNANGTVSFAPCTAAGVPDASCTAPFAGAVPAIGYRVTDSVGQFATSTVTVTVNPPTADVANADTSTGFAGAVQSANPLSNDSAPAGVTLLGSSVRLCASGIVPPNCISTSVVVPGKGVYVDDTVAGLIRFVPCNTQAGSLAYAGVTYGTACTGTPFTGTPAAVTYQVSDNLSTPRTVSATYTPTVVGPPNAVDDTSTGPYGQAQTVAVLGNDHAYAATSLVTSSVRLCGPGDDSTINGAGSCDDTMLTTSAGTYLVNANGMVTFTPVSGFSGPAPAVTYQVADALGQKDAATISVSVAAPVGPTAADDTVTLLPGAGSTFRAITGAGGLATPGDGALVPADTCLIDPAAPGSCDADDAVSVPGVGTWQLNRSTGVVNFQADPSATAGVMTGVAYRVTDGNGQTATATLVLVIPPPPAATDDTSYGEQGMPIILSPMGNDVAGTTSAPLVVTSVRLCGPGQPPGCNATALIVPEGTYAVNPSTGQVVFTPTSPTFVGTATAVTYAVSDSAGQMATARVQAVLLDRPAPIAVDDAGSAGYGQTVTLSPLANDSAGTAPGDGSVSGLTLTSSSLRLCATGQSPNACSSTSSVTTVDGTYVISGSDVVFTPATGFSGRVTAPLQYQVSNSYTQVVAGNPAAKTQTATAYLIPTIGAPAPSSSAADAKTGLVNTPVSLSPLANDTDGQLYPLQSASLRLCAAGDTTPHCTATSVSVPDKGTFALNPATGVVTFTPEPGWTGSATVPYGVSDTGGTVVGATITVTVNAPQASNDDSYGLPGLVQTTPVLVNDSPASGTGTTLDAASVRLCGPSDAAPSCTQTSVTTSKGTYTVSGSGVVTFTPASGFTDGDDAVAYSVRDSAGQVATALVRPHVVAPPLPAVADDTAYTSEGRPAVFRPWGNDTSMGNRTVGTVAYVDGGLTHGSVRLCGPGGVPGSCDDTTLTTVDGIYAVDLAGANAGQVTFTPAPGFTGVAAYPVSYEIANAYTVNGAAATEIARALLTPIVVAAPTAAAVDDTGAASYGQQVTFTPWSNDSRAASSTSGSVSYANVGSANGFDAATVRLCGTGVVVPACDDTKVTTVDGTYTVVLSGDDAGKVTFTPAAGFTGAATAPPTYQISSPYSIANSSPNYSGAGTAVTSARLLPTVGPLTPPNADPDAGSGYRDDTVTVNLLANDDTGTFPLVAASILLCDDTDVAPACTHFVVVLPGQGTATVNPDGTVSFVPDSGWTGQVSLPYSVADSQGNRDFSTVTITMIAPVMPVAGDDSATTPAGTPVSVPAGTDDTRGTYPLVLGTVRLCGVGDVAPACDDTIVTDATGTFTVNGDGTVSFRPAPGFSGPAAIVYSIADDHGNRDDGLISIAVTAPPSGGGGGSGSGGGGGGGSGGGGSGGGGAPGPVPVTDDDHGVVRPGNPVTLDPIGNDVPGQGQSFDGSSLRLCPNGSTPPDCAATQATTPQGTWTVDPRTGGVTFAPADGFKGKVEMPYQVETSDGQVVDAVITVWVTDPPKAADDVSSGRADTPQALDPWENDSPDAAPWVTSSLRLCGAAQSPPQCDSTRVETPDGVYAIDPATGTVVFTPTPGFTGTATPLRYQVTDEAGQVADAWLRPSVRSSSGAGTGTLIVTKKVLTGDEWRTGNVKLVTTCTDGVRQLRRTHLMPVGTHKQSWRVAVPAGMTCSVAERHGGQPDPVSVQPTLEGQRWPSSTVARLATGETARLGTAVPIERLEVSAKGGCSITASRLRAATAGMCVLTWRVPDGVVSSTTRWAYSTPVTSTRSTVGTATAALAIAAGQATRVTFVNTYTAAAATVTRTVAVVPDCPVTKARPAEAGDPGSCPATKASPLHGQAASAPPWWSRPRNAFSAL
ncbi:MAG: Ig-like domain-containing protein [Candidatus Nanopelagicales bacterium]